MARLLIVSRYPDRDFESADYAFVYHQVTCLQPFYDEIHVVAPTPWFPGMLRPLGGVWEKLRLRMLKQDYTHGNVRVHFAPFAPWAGRLPGGDRVRALWPAIQRTVRRHALEFDLVHAHMTMGFGWHGLQLARRQGVPSVLTIHESDDWIDVLKAGRWDVMQALRETDALIRVTPTDIDEIRRLTGTTRPIHYIPNGFDQARVSDVPRDALRRDLGLPADRTIFVSVARWVERKDPLTLIEGLHRMAEGRTGNDRPLLCMIGEDLMGGRIQQRIRERGLEADVRLVGPLPPERVLAWMRASDAVVLYSVNEGNPTVMFEALGCGRPFLGSDVGGVRAILCDPRLGGYGPPRDPDALAGLLARACRTRWDEAFILEQARQYTWESIARRVYEEVHAPLLATASAA